MVILVDAFEKVDSIEDVVFATKQQGIVAKLLILNMKENGGIFTKTEMALFANRLHNGDINMMHRCREFVVNKTRVSYNKRQFYERILNPMKMMGLIEYSAKSRTYFLSNRFTKLMAEIGDAWRNEIREASHQMQSQLQPQLQSQHDTLIQLDKINGKIHGNRFPQPIFSN